MERFAPRLIKCGSFAAEGDPGAFSSESCQGLTYIPSFEVSMVESRKFHLGCRLHVIRQLQQVDKAANMRKINSFYTGPVI